MRIFLSVNQSTDGGHSVQRSQNVYLGAGVKVAPLIQREEHRMQQQHQEEAVAVYLVLPVGTRN